MCGIIYILRSHLLKESEEIIKILEWIINLSNSESKFIKHVQEVKNEKCSIKEEEKEEEIKGDLNIGGNKMSNSNSIFGIKKREIIKRICKRGPDFVSGLVISNSLSEGEVIRVISREELEEEGNLSDFLGEEGTQVQIYSSVLHLRGEVDQLTSQPLYDKSTHNILSFNGEIFAVNQHNLENSSFKYIEAEDMREFSFRENDGQQIFSILNKMCKNYGNSSPEPIESLTGEINDVLLNIFEGDFALVYHNRTHSFLYISKDIFGKRSLGVCYNRVKGELGISSSALSNSFEYIDIPGNCSLVIRLDIYKEFKCWTHQNTSYPFPSNYRFRSGGGDIIQLDLLNLQDLLSEAIRKRVLNIPHIQQHINHMNTLTPFTQIPDQYPLSTHSHVAILFSGGIDSLLLAHILHLSLPPHLQIDLLSVSFEENSPDRITSIVSYMELKGLTPGREWNMIFIDVEKEEIKETEELLRELVHPKDTIMDLSIATALHFASRGQGILWQGDKGPLTDLIFQLINDISSQGFTIQNLQTGLPLVSLDEKLKDLISTEIRQSKNFVKSSPRVLLSGLGADEIFGGYGRYIIHLKNNKLQEIEQEMSLDIDRLWIRNLARDDRVIAQNSKEVRYPFLDLQLFLFLSNYHINQYFHSPANWRGLKKIQLRLLAQKLGYNNAIWDENCTSIQQSNIWISQESKGMEQIKLIFYQLLEDLEILENEINYLKLTNQGITI